MASGGYANPRQAALDQAHQQNKGRPAAFLDESFRGFEYPDEPPFYVLTAVVVEWDDMVPIRERLVEIAGGDFWHTNKSFRTETGRQRTWEMLEYLAEGVEPCVVAVQDTVDEDDSDLERARAACMERLLCGLEAGGPTWGQVRLAVMEERHDQRHRNRDDRTFRDLIRTGSLHRAFRLHQTDPGVEHLLWLADVVSYAVRTDLARGDSGLRDVIAERITELP